MRTFEPRPISREDEKSAEGLATPHLIPDNFHHEVRFAAERVAEHLPEELRDGPDGYKVLGRLDFLVEALVSGEEPEQKEFTTRTDVAALQRLLHLLYAEVLDAWSERMPSKAEMLRVLRSFQRVRDEIVPQRAEDHAISWTVPESADLVVELAHDLRSPLTSIIFLTESLRRGQGGGLSDQQKRQLGIIYSAALSMVSMASDVIELTRGGARLMEREPTRFSIAELLDSVRDILSPIAEEKGLELRISSPEMDQRLGHPVALSRVILNLVSNALRYTESGYVEVAATVTGPSMVEFSVRDTGPGLDEEAERRLFEPLRRNPRNNRFGFSGSGLGLAICRRLVRSMGGELNYVTSPGWGTRFVFPIDLPSAPLP